MCRCRLPTCPENLFQTHAQKIKKKKPKSGSRSGGVDAVFVCEDLEGAWFSAQRKPLREDQDHESLREIEAGES